MKAIRHTGIVVSNLKQALHFYKDLFNFKIVKRMEESGEYIDKISGLKNVKVTTVKMSAEDGNLIELLHYGSHIRTLSTKRKICDVGISHVAFTVENIGAEYRRLSRVGIKFNSPPRVSPDGYAKVTFCRGPDGILIELVEVLNKR